MRRCASAALLVACVLVAACGGRVSQEQVLAEAAEDGYGGAGGGELAGGPTGAARPTATGASGTGATGSGGTGAGAGDATSAGGGDAGAIGATEAAPTPPPGGNGGATDVGVTEDRIILGNVATVTGAVPGLFRGAITGVQAWAAMINSQGGIDGRLIEVRHGDDGLDDGRNRSAHISLKDQVFAFVGSFSVNDVGGASELANTNIPDVGVPLAPQRNDLPNNFSPSPLGNGWETGPGRYYIQNFGEQTVRRTAFFVSSAEAARISGRRQRAVLESLGYEIVYTREVQPNEPNYTGDVIQMRSQGVTTVMWEGQADQLADLWVAMHDQGFEPTLLNPGSTAYSHAFVEQAGEAAEGSRIDVTHALYLAEDCDGIDEVCLFQEWMQRVDPDQDVDLFAAFGWAAGRLFEQALREAGPQVTRDGVLQALSGITSFDANGLLAPANPAGKVPTDCFLVIRIENGQFVREHPAQGFDCTTGPWQRLG